MTEVNRVEGRDEGKKSEKLNVRDKELSEKDERESERGTERELKTGRQMTQSCQLFLLDFVVCFLCVDRNSKRFTQLDNIIFVILYLKLSFSVSTLVCFLESTARTPNSPLKVQSQHIFFQSYYDDKMKGRYDE